MNESAPSLAIELRGGEEWTKTEVGQMVTTAFRLIDNGVLPTNSVSFTIVAEGPKKAVVGPPDFHPAALSTVTSAFQQVLGENAKVVMDTQQAQVSRGTPSGD